MAIENHLPKWITYLFQGAKKFGESGFDKRLRDLCGFGPESQHAQIKNAIFAEINKVYGVPVKVLLRSNKRGAHAEARMIAIVLLNRHLRLTQAEIGQIFGVGDNLISMRLRAFNNAGSPPLTEGERLMGKICASKEFIKNHDDINEKIYAIRAMWDANA